MNELLSILESLQEMMNSSLPTLVMSLKRYYEYVYKRLPTYSRILCVEGSIKIEDVIKLMITLKLKRYHTFQVLRYVILSSQSPSYEYVVFIVLSKNKLKNLLR